MGRAPQEGQGGGGSRRRRRHARGEGELKSVMGSLRRVVALAVIAFAALTARAEGGGGDEPLDWHGPTTGQALRARVLAPTATASPSAPLPLVVYLKNLSIPRLGREADESILRDLLATGHLVLE